MPLRNRGGCVLESNDRPDTRLGRVWNKSLLFPEALGAKPKSPKPVTLNPETRKPLNPIGVSAWGLGALSTPRMREKIPRRNLEHAGDPGAEELQMGQGPWASPGPGKSIEVASRSRLPSSCSLLFLVS